MVRVHLLVIHFDFVFRIQSLQCLGLGIVGRKDRESGIQLRVKPHVSPTMLLLQPLFHFGVWPHTVGSRTCSGSGLRDYSWQCTQEPCLVPEIKPGLTACKASALSAGLFDQPHEGCGAHSLVHGPHSDA